MFANSNGQELKKHLLGVMQMAMYCADHLGITDPELKEVISLAAFFHDIGKCTDYFQNITLPRKYSSEKDLFKLIKKQYPTFSGKPGVDFYPRHNEISWLFAVRYAKAKTLFKSVGLQAIYWHHATYHHNPLDGKDKRYSKTIIDELVKFSNKELTNIDIIISSIIKDIPFISKYIEDNVDTDNLEVPRLFDNTQEVDDKSNSQRWITRSCVVFADHLVSSLSVSELDDLLAGNIAKYFPILSNIKDIQFNPPIDYDRARFESQKDIVANTDRTTIVKAPAGYGKTLIGLMWSCKQQGQIYWVCPRNSVAEGVYDNIVDEINRFEIPVSAELYLTSERKDCTDTGIAECKSDIVITNIDNLLAPTVSHKHVSRIFDIMARNIVFDEFHEFINDEALFGAFMVYMKTRNIFCNNCKTLLLSATPSICYQYWSTGKKPVKVLPDTETHYPAQHNKPYTFEFGNTLIESPKEKTLTMYSSISNVQNCYKNGYTMIIHSKYSDKDRQRKTKEITTHFNKTGDKDGTVISAPLLQAAFDISFNGLYKTMESPESDIQTLGRINRWGENNNSNVMFLDMSGDIRERNAIITRYDWSLSKQWALFVNKHFTNPLTLDEIYKLYNQFNIEYKSEISNFISTKKYAPSIEKLSRFFPTERRKPDFDTNVKISVRNLRNYGPSYFVVIKDKNTGDWYDYAFNISEREFKEKIQENRDKLESSTIKTVWENLNNLSFDYSELINKFFGKRTKQKLYAERLFYSAKSSETPVPIWDWEYDNELGIVEK